MHVFQFWILFFSFAFKLTKKLKTDRPRKISQIICTSIAFVTNYDHKLLQIEQQKNENKKKIWIWDEAQTHTNSQTNPQSTLGLHNVSLSTHFLLPLFIFIFQNVMNLLVTGGYLSLHRRRCCSGHADAATTIAYTSPCYGNQFKLINNFSNDRSEWLVLAFLREGGRRGGREGAPLTNKQQHPTKQSTIVQSFVVFLTISKSIWLPCGFTGLSRKISALRSCGMRL